MMTVVPGAVSGPDSTPCQPDGTGGSLHPKSQCPSMGDRFTHPWLRATPKTSCQYAVWSAKPAAKYCTHGTSRSSNVPCPRRTLLPSRGSFSGAAGSLSAAFPEDVSPSGGLPFESIVVVTCCSRMRKLPRMVDLVVSGSPMPSCPVETSVAYKGVLPCQATSTWLSMEMSIHFSPSVAGLGHSVGTSAAPASVPLSHLPSVVSRYVTSPTLRALPDSFVVARRASTSPVFSGSSWSDAKR